MQPQSQNKLLITVALCVSAATMAATWYWLGAQTAAPADAPAPRTAAWDGPIGPGQVRAEAPEAAAPATVEGTGLTLDAAGRLVPDRALLALIDDTLAQADAATIGARVAELHTFFKTRLPAQAAQDGQRILNDYLQYLRMRQAARASVTPLDPAGLTDADVGALLAWQSQQAQLRERMLGAALSKAWFAQPDSRCGAALRDWRQRRQPGVPQDPVRDADAQSCADQLMANFVQGG